MLNYSKFVSDQTYLARAIVGILKKSGIANHFRGDVRSSEGGSESVKKTFATFWSNLGF